MLYFEIDIFISLFKCISIAYTYNPHNLYYISYETPAIKFSFSDSLPVRGEFRDIRNGASY